MLADMAMKLEAARAHSIASLELKELYQSLEEHLLPLGSDTTRQEQQFHFRFRRTQDFACVEVKPKAGKLRVFVRVNPDTVNLESGFTRDMRGIYHSGTGDLEVVISSPADLEKAKPLLQESYNAS